MVKKFNYVMSERMDEGDDYFRLFSNVVNVLETARTKLARQFSATVASSYWEIGKLLAELKLEGRHGDGVVKRLSSDLKHLYPDMGFSPRNLWNMKKFYHRYESSDLKLQQAVAVLPWSHNLLLLSKGVNDEAVMFYSHEVVSKGWSRDMLNHALKSGWHLSAMVSESFNNFAAVLPDKQAEYANEVFRSRYNLGFVAVETPLKELELERETVICLNDFLTAPSRNDRF